MRSIGGTPEFYRRGLCPIVAGIDPADRPPAFGQSAVAGHSMEGMSVVPARSHPINGNAVTNAMALRQSADSFGRAGL